MPLKTADVFLVHNGMFKGLEILNHVELYIWFFRLTQGRRSLVLTESKDRSVFLGDP